MLAGTPTKGDTRLRDLLAFILLASALGVATALALCGVTLLLAAPAYV
jgi:hypothetical protein